ncbi:hypothetical protein PQQ63_12525 [Paraburkholderia metrosideri]|uniref:Uncharacterized protein n=1 Tax=Paraburkholderia metrosideri TaxID=580937 RepID=A0ABW9DSK9_9BURK
MQYWTSALHYLRAQAAQRNKVVFDDSAALTRVLHSPVRHALREHLLRALSLRALSLGGNSTHYPMTSRSLQLPLQPAKDRETT